MKKKKWIIIICFIVVLVVVLVCMSTSVRKQLGLSGKTVEYFQDIDKADINKIDYVCLTGDNRDKQFTIEDKDKIEIVVNELLELTREKELTPSTGRNENGLYQVWLYHGTDKKSQFIVIDEKTISNSSSHFFKSLFSGNKKLKMIDVLK